MVNGFSEGQNNWDLNRSIRPPNEPGPFQPTILVMKARTLGYVITALAPVWLLAYFAIQGRFFTSPFVSFEYGAKTTEQIVAFAPAVRKTMLLQDQVINLDPQALDETAQTWIRFYEAGKLKCIEPLTADDDGTEGFRAEIEGSRKTIIYALRRDYARLVEAKKYDAAANRLSQILIIGQIAKYNSSFATFSSASSQIECLHRYQEIRPHLSTKAHQTMNRAIQIAQGNPDRVLHTITRLAAFGQNKNYIDGVELPDKEQTAVVLVSLDHEPPSELKIDARGVLLINSYRTAYRQEIALQKAAANFTVTAQIDPQTF
jgi:hypothetical protein